MVKSYEAKRLPDEFNNVLTKLITSLFLKNDFLLIIFIYSSAKINIRILIHLCEFHFFWIRKTQLLPNKTLFESTGLFIRKSISRHRQWTMHLYQFLPEFIFFGIYFHRIKALFKDTFFLESTKDIQVSICNFNSINGISLWYWNVVYNGLQENYLLI